jgi:hypothetical protein
MNRTTNILLTAILVALVAVGAILLTNNSCHEDKKLVTCRPSEVQSTIRTFQSQGWEFESQKDDPMLNSVYIWFAKRCK